jgi:CheY-like chemotaxis protein
VAVTGFDMYDEERSAEERSVEAGFSTHLSKPIDPPALTQAIRDIRH